MLVYKRENGYGKQDLDEVREVIHRVCGVGSKDKVILLELLYDYEVLLRVIDGEAIFRHEDRSEARRLKLYGE